MKNLARTSAGTALAALLLAGATSAHVSLEAPQGGAALTAGETTVIIWHVIVQHDTVGWDLEYSITGPDGPWIPIATHLPVGDPTMDSVHTYPWTVPDVPSHEYRVRVRQDNMQDIDYYDQSFGDLSVAGSSLNADVSQLSIAAGGTQNLSLEAGTPHAGSMFLLLGSTLGTSPGIPLGTEQLPLNPDFYLTFVLTHPGTAPLTGGVRTLDAGGAAGAQFSVAPGILPASLAGASLNHAFVVLDASFGVTFASNSMLLHLGS